MNSYQNIIRERDNTVGRINPSDKEEKTPMNEIRDDQEKLVVLAPALDVAKEDSSGNVENSSRKQQSAEGGATTPHLGSLKCNSKSNELKSIVLSDS